MSETFEEVKHHASKGDVCHDAEQSAFYVKSDILLTAVS